MSGFKCGAEFKVRSAAWGTRLNLIELRMQTEAHLSPPTPFHYKINKVAI